MNSHQLAFIEETVGHKLTEHEIIHYSSQHSSTAGYFLSDDRPLEGRKILILYTACWGNLILDYFRKYRSDILDQYNCYLFLDYALILNVLRDHVFDTPEFLMKLFHRADAVIYSSVGQHYQQFSSESLLKKVREDCKLGSTFGPHQGCWWPICPGFGEEPVYRYLDQGLTIQEIFTKFKDSTFDPLFHDRFIEQMAFMKGKQSNAITRLADFIKQHYKRCKMFFTYSHPTYNVIAYIVNEILGQWGFEKMGEDHVLSLPPDAMMLGDVFPETHYEFEYYGFQYPIRWPNGSGGSDSFYAGAIRDAAKNWSKRKGFPESQCNYSIARPIARSRGLQGTRTKRAR